MQDYIVEYGGEKDLSSERYNAIDFVKCFAAFAIVCLHTEPFANAEISAGRHIYFIIDTIARFAVPFFFMVSGFLFAKKVIIVEEHSADYCVRYLKKIAWLYFGWTFFYLLYYMGQALLVSYVNHTDFISPFIPERSTIPIIKWVIQIFCLGYAGVHLWYLIALLWSMFILFFFIQRKKINSLLLMSFVLNVIGVLGNAYQGVIPFYFPTRNAVFFGLFYCTLGGFFAYHEKTIRDKTTSFAGFGFGYLFWLFCVIQLLERTYITQNFQSEIPGEFFFSTIPLSICFFFWVLSKTGNFKESALTVIGRNSLGVFVIHYFFISVLGEVGLLLGLNSRTVIYQLLFTPLVFIVSYLVYEYLQKIKFRLIP